MDFVSKFIDSLHLNSELKRFAKVLIKTKEDCTDFYINHLGNNDYIIDDLLDYRQSKISMSDITFDKFKEMCDNIGIKKAFEETFLYYFNLNTVKLIESLIANGKTSLEEIYSLFVSNPDENIVKYITLKNVV